MKVELPPELAEFVRTKIRNGEFASESEVLLASVRALQESELEFERWLLDDVAAAYDAHRADPSSAVDLDEAANRLRQLIGVSDAST
jgi:antitoxin ParD1/3/4